MFRVGLVGTVVGMGSEKRLTARQVVTLGAGYHSDGAGLYLQVTPTGARSWILRYQLHGRRREMGLGSASLVTLAEARQKALDARKMIADGKDPIEHRQSERSHAARTWGGAVADFIAAHAHGWKNDAQADQWRQSLKAYGPPDDMPISAITTTTVIALLRKIWTDKTETATRVRGRIERIWAAEKIAGSVHGENPARWRGHLDVLLPKPARVSKVQHHAAMPYADLPAFWQSLMARDGIARRALRFTILTAARTGEVTSAQWNEFDLDRGFWDRPAEHMKAGKGHTIPLTPAAIACLDGLPRNKPPFALSENGMLYLLQKDLGKPDHTVHGFRSTFRDWAGETTSHPREVIEHALAHQIRDKSEAAYARGQLIEKRRSLMADWERYCVSGGATL